MSDLQFSRIIGEVCFCAPSASAYRHTSECHELSQQLHNPGETEGMRVPVHPLRAIAAMS